MVYHEDFSDRRSGWPDQDYPGTDAHYIAGGYKLSRLAPGRASVPAVEGLIAVAADTIAAYGPWWGNFHASMRLEAYWRRPDAAVGMVFDVMERGYYAFLLAAPGDAREMAFELVKGRWDGTRSTIIPRTPIAQEERPGKAHKLSVERNRGQIILAVDDRQVGSIQDTTFEYGLVGIGVFKESHVIVRDLLVQAIR